MVGKLQLMQPLHTGGPCLSRTTHSPYCLHTDAQCVGVSVCECVSDTRLCLVDGAIQSLRRAPQKCRLVTSTLFQVVSGFDARHPLFFPLFHSPRTTNNLKSPVLKIKNYRLFLQSKPNP